MRNVMAQEAVKGGYSHLLMLDADGAYPRNTLMRLLEHEHRLQNPNSKGVIVGGLSS